MNRMIEFTNEVEEIGVDTICINKRRRDGFGDREKRKIIACTSADGIYR